MHVRIIPADKLNATQGGEWVDPTRRTFVDAGKAYVPVKDGFDYDCELNPPKKYRGTGYQMIGDTALIHYRMPSEDELESLIEWQKPACVLLLKGYEGIKRTPIVEVLYGETHEVCHKENGCIYTLDPSKVMFSMGNRNEKTRMAKMTRSGERIADMFAGIGYFTLPAAIAGAKVHAMEINPISCGYLVKNAELNGVSGRVDAECGDCRDLLKGKYDRAFMGHFESQDMLPDILPHMKQGGILHVHSIDDITDTIRAALGESGFDADGAEISVNRVKKYAPHRWHIVSDVLLP
ncbi:MAG: SAM-dependent methyltransferase [Methanomicrobium sp.]|nr:SAM-dependent methyltransferase [Methanomicrobium sp.]